MERDYLANMFQEQIKIQFFGDPEECERAKEAFFDFIEKFQISLEYEINCCIDKDCEIEINGNTITVRT